MATMNVMRIVLPALLALPACNSSDSPLPSGGSVQVASHADARWWEPACGTIRVAHVGGADAAPRVIHRVEPERPGGLRIEGIAIVAAVVTESGTVCDARVLRGVGAAADAAVVRAVEQWRFTPATKRGKPVAAVFHLTVPFAPRADATMPDE